MEGFFADEYFYYHFADKSEQERANFISDQNRVIFCDTVNKFKNLALTDNGWVMVEGNARGQFIWQISTQEGFLAEANSILRRLGKKEMKKLSM